MKMKHDTADSVGYGTCSPPSTVARHCRQKQQPQNWTVAVALTLCGYSSTHFARTARSVRRSAHESASMRRPQDQMRRGGPSAHKAEQTHHAHQCAPA